MVRAFNREFDGRFWTEYKGLSNDPRPLNAKEEDVFIETDTLDVYYFNGTSWAQVYPYLYSGPSNESQSGTLTPAGPDNWV